MTRWMATTGDVPLTAATTAATVQQPATNSAQVWIDYLVLSATVATTFTIKANGAAATTTAGTVNPIIPAQILSFQSPFNFFTASNAGAGTIQGQVYVPANTTVVFLLNPLVNTDALGNVGDSVALNTNIGTGANLTVTSSSVTGNVNIGFFGRFQ